MSSKSIVVQEQNRILDMNSSLDKKTIKNWKVDVIEHVDDFDRKYCYEHYEAVVAISDFDHGKKYKLCCESCRKFGKNLACPPFSPSFIEYIEGAKTAKVICLRVPTDYFNQPTAEETYRTCFRMARNLLVSELLKYREDGYYVAGSGACLACDTCAVENDDQKCKKPKKRIYSLESLGVNVIALVKKSFEFDLDWNDNQYLADFVSAVGAVFFKEEVP